MVLFACAPPNRENRETIEPCQGRGGAFRPSFVTQAQDRPNYRPPPPPYRGTAQDLYFTHSASVSFRLQASRWLVSLYRSSSQPSSSLKIQFVTNQRRQAKGVCLGCLGDEQQKEIPDESISRRSVKRVRVRGVRRLSSASIVITTMSKEYMRPERNLIPPGFMATGEVYSTCRFMLLLSSDVH